MHFSILHRGLVASFFFALISACGGGGGDSSTPVSDTNNLPVFNSSTAISLYETEQLDMALDITDADNDTLNVTVNNLPSWLVFDAATLSISGASGLDAQGEHSFDVIIDDGHQTPVTTTMTLSVEDAISLSGKVIDGYISGAKVYIDENNNKTLDDGEFYAITDELGNYQLAFPSARKAELAFFPIRAFIGEGAKDISREELDFTSTPITLSLPPINIDDIEENNIENLAISPFTEEVSKSLEEKITELTNEELTAEEFQFQVEQTKSEIFNDIVIEGNIELVRTDLSIDEIKDVVFGDFVAMSQELPEILTHGEKIVDGYLDSHDEADFDNDGIINSLDTDDDNDTYFDTVDAFPYDANEWSDSDGDNVGNNADAYPTDPACSASTDGNDTQCYITWLGGQTDLFIAVSKAGVIFNYTQSNGLIVIDSLTNEVLHSETISNVSVIEYHESHQRLYIGHSNGQIQYLDENYVLSSFTTLQGPITNLLEAGEFLILSAAYSYNSTPYFFGGYYSYDNEGIQISYYDTQLYEFDSPKISWDPLNQRIIEPDYSRQFNYYNVDDNGVIGNRAYSPYSANNIFFYPLKAFTSQRGQVLTNAGYIFSDFDSEYVISNTINENVEAAAWLENGDLITISTSNDDFSKKIIKRRNINLDIVEVQYMNVEDGSTASNSQAFIITENNKASIVLKSLSSLTFFDYVPNDDTDGDGVNNTLDAFPLDVAASIDSDNDGFPDSWNVGARSENSTTSLSLDQYPLDSSCYLITHGDNGVCNYSQNMPVFEISDIDSDALGNVYFLNADDQRVYRWSASTNDFTNPIVLNHSALNTFGIPTHINVSDEHNRLYVAYSNGTISYVDLAELTTEYLFNNTHSIYGIKAVGDFVLIQDNSSTLKSYDIDGALVGEYFFTGNIKDIAFDSDNSQFYAADGSFLQSYYIEPVTGFISSGNTFPLYQLGIHYYGPVKLSTDNAKLLFNSGELFDIDGLTLSGRVNLNYIYKSQFTEGSIAAIDNYYDHIDDSPKLKFYTTSDYQLIGELGITGNAIELLPNQENLSLVTILESGRINVSAILLEDKDEDGIPAWWEINYSLDDNNADDAQLDGDEDGLSNLEEFQARSNPTLSDTDDDGLSDGDEVNEHSSSPLKIDSDLDGLIDSVEVNDYQTSPILADTDGDGLSDTAEINIHSSDPLKGDSDDDGINDLFEVSNSLNVSTDDANEDADSDGLINIDEFTLGTDVNISDTDSDGLSDGDEYHTYLTLPLNRDSDSDNIPDGWEILYSFDPLDDSDAALDTDLDSFSNKIEFFLSSDPTDIGSVPRPTEWNSFQADHKNSGFMAINIDPDNISLRWNRELANPNSGHVIASGGKVVISEYSFDLGGGQLIALNADNADLDWRVSFTSNGRVSNPVYYNNKVYVLSDNNNDTTLSSFNISNGDKVFETDIAGNINGYSEGNVFDNALYFCERWNGVTIKLDAMTGEEQWSSSLNSCNTTPVIGENNVYTFQNDLIFLDKETGASEIISSNYWFNDSSLTLGNANDAFFIGDDGLVTYNTNTAEIIWQTWYTDYNDRLYGNPSVALGKVYALNQNSLVAYDEFTGAELWSWQTANNSSLEGNIVLTMNLAFVQDSYNTYAIDLTTQQQVWSYPMSGQVSLSLEGAFYILSSRDNSITAFNIAGDSDDDGMDDWWERLYALNPNDDSDASLNNDGDNLTNLEEFTYSTNPLLEDTDNDGISDSDEVNTYLSNPNSTDSDSDGMPDGWEVEQGLDLNNPLDALLDADGDSISNVDEYTESSDPNDADSIPTILSTAVYSFEDSVIPDSWVIDNTQNSFEVTTLESSDGDNSILSTDKAAFELSGYFSGNYFTLDAKSSCTFGNILLYIDDELVVENGYMGLTDEWQTFSILIPKGYHAIKVQTGYCTTYIDNITLSSLEDIFSMDISFVSKADDYLSFYNDENVLQRIVKIEAPIDDYNQEAREITVLDDGRIAILNGHSSPYVSVYNPLEHSWLHLTNENWSSGFGFGNGGIASIGNDVYATNIFTSESPSMGIVKFDLSQNSSTLIAGKSYTDITIGLDGYLYALAETAIDKYQISTMELLNTFTITISDNLSVDSEGNLYTTRNYDGNVYKYNNQGVQIDVFNTERVESALRPSIILDIKIDELENLYLTDVYGKVYVLDNALTEINVSEGVNADYLSFTPFEDADNDGMPKWWEEKYGLSDNDASDAALDLDEEGVTNLDEYLTQLDPSKADTDDDTLDDYIEINTYFTDPRLGDTDTDGLSDSDEIDTYLTDPLDVDSDDDTFSDGFEVLISDTDPLDDASVPNHHIYNFDLGLFPSEFIQPTGSSASWYIDRDSIRSGDIEDNQYSSFEYSRYYSAGTLTFDSTVSSESCCDYLEVYVDDIRVLRQDTQSNVTNEIILTEGEHTIEFRYRKDYSVSRDSDTVWVDNILFTPSI